jgi:hypothetical protein
VRYDAGGESFGGGCFWFTVFEAGEDTPGKPWTVGKAVGEAVGEATATTGEVGATGDIGGDAGAALGLGCAAWAAALGGDSGTVDARMGGGGGIASPGAIFRGGGGGGDDFCGAVGAEGA